MPLTTEQQNALARMAEAAVNAEQSSGLPAEISVAQCILESAWLRRAPGNNCFGIKNTNRFPGAQYLFTKEFTEGVWATSQQAFEVYPDLTACFADHSGLLTGKYGRNVYTPCWEQYLRDGSVDGLVLGIAKYYATDPEYAKIVTVLVHGPNVAAAVLQAAKDRVVAVAEEGSTLNDLAPRRTGFDR